MLYGAESRVQDAGSNRAGINVNAYRANKKGKNIIHFDHRFRIYATKREHSTCIYLADL